MSDDEHEHTDACNHDHDHDDDDEELTPEELFETIEIADCTSTPDPCPVTRATARPAPGSAV